jgi:cyclic pyranopterin phosphate synthase
MLGSCQFMNLLAPDALPLVDPFGRAISYLRLSVTDRCDLRCAYCMDENVKFVPRREVLTLEELDRLAAAFVGLGVRKIRITGGEPLVRGNIMWLMQRLARHLERGALGELTLTTNATRLARYASQLAALGVRRVNVSLDTRDAARFRTLTRNGELEPVLAGIDAALAAGLKLKLNMVVMKDFNDHEVADMVTWAHARSMALTLIEVMPFGDGERWLPSLIGLDEVRRRLEQRFTLTDVPERSGGPARYVEVKETGGKLGFITPMSGNFCESCNRIRVTCKGRLYQCLGREAYVDLRAALREHAGNAELRAAIRDAIAAKPEGHDFAERRACADPKAQRPMSETGG